MHPIMILAFVLLAAVALAPVSYFAFAPDAMTVDLGSAHGGGVATPNHDPHHRVALMQRPAAEPVAADPVATEPVATETVVAEAGATPNHDPHHLGPLPTFALNPVILRVEPEPAAPSAPGFVAADTVLYAKDGARLRAAPDTAADILTKLAADASLRATARSTDGVWWRVSLADGRFGYVHRTAVSQDRVVLTKPMDSEPAPVVAEAPAQPVSARRSQGLLGYVDDTMNWLADKAGHGSAPAAIRTEH
jgi:hypothetical protein